MENIEIREMSKRDADTNVILGTAFRIKLILALITMVLVIGTAIIFEADRFTVAMIALYSLSIILDRFTVIRNYFTSIVWNEYIVKTEISRTVIGAAIKIALLLLKAPLWAFIAATVFDVALLSAGYVMAYRSKIGAMSLWRYDGAVAKYLLKQSFPLLLSGAAIVVYQRIDQVMIGNMIDKAAVGQFSVATRFVEILIFVPTIIAQVVTPVLVKEKERNYDSYLSKSQLFMNVMVWLSIVISVLFSVISYWVVIWTFGDEYILSVPVLRVMSFKTVCTALFAMSGQMMIVEHIHSLAVVRNIVGSIVCVTLNLLLLPEFGIIGAAYVAVISMFVSGFFVHIFIPKYHYILRMQTISLFCGWKDMFNIRRLLR
jgi:O-antigen/teichoic acid export membrane protein